MVGVGGGGGSAINRMKEAGVTGVEFIAINMDLQALHFSNADKKVSLGNGLGAGGDPEKGAKAAEESRDAIAKALEGADMAFIAFGAGGGTGSGAAPIVAEEAKKQGILTVGVVTKPFEFEGLVRMRKAEKAIDRMAKEVDSLVVIPNQRIMETLPADIPFLDSFRYVDDVLRQGVQGISELITNYSDINLDFADVRAVMENAGSALMGIGTASGENRAVTAAKEAIDSPLIEVKIDGAKGILYLVSSGENISAAELASISEVITQNASPDANILFGVSIRPELGDELTVTVVATGFDRDSYSEEYYDEPSQEKATEQDSSATPTDTATAQPEPTSDPKKAQIAQDAKDFTADNKTNMWDAIRTDTEDDDNDVPPLLRNRFRDRKKQ